MFTTAYNNQVAFVIYVTLLPLSQICPCKLALWNISFGYSSSEGLFETFELISKCTINSNFIHRLLLLYREICFRCNLIQWSWGMFMSHHIGTKLSLARKIHLDHIAYKPQSLLTPSCRIMPLITLNVYWHVE